MSQQPAQRPRLLQAMVDAFRQEDVRRKLLFTLAMLVIFRFVAHVPIPNVDRDALKTAFEGNALLDFLSIFSGGALQNLSVAALGVYPYITASIVIQILTPLIPQFRALSEEGEQGRRRLQVYTHWGAVPCRSCPGLRPDRLHQQPEWRRSRPELRHRRPPDGHDRNAADAHGRAPCSWSGSAN